MTDVGGQAGFSDAEWRACVLELLRVTGFAFGHPGLTAPPDRLGLLCSPLQMWYNDGDMVPAAGSLPVEIRRW